jgi:hypothetical protein
MESSEAAHGSGCGSIAETRAANIRGTGSAERTSDGRAETSPFHFLNWSRSIPTNQRTRAIGDWHYWVSQGYLF